MQKPDVSITVKCVSCSNRDTLTTEQIERASVVGCAFCSKCGSPAVVQSVKAKLQSKAR
jgi:radical SAM superfamily enzyme